MTDDTGLRARTVALSAGASLGVFYLLLRIMSDRGRTLPQHSWMTVAVILVIAAGVLGCAWSIRSYLHGTIKEPPAPQFARRVLVAARASALAGGVIGGFYAAEALVRLPNIEVARQQSAIWLALVLTLLSGLLAVAGLVAQAWCRIPPDDDDDPGRKASATY